MGHLPAWEDVVSSGLTSSQCYEQVCQRYAPERESFRKAALYIQENLPQAAQAVIAQADEYLKGMMVLCGTMGKPYFVGNPPRWADNPVGDVEYIFMLNRMEHWPVLLQAYYLTGDKVYAEKVVSELDNWINTCPPWKSPWTTPWLSPGSLPEPPGGRWSWASGPIAAGIRCCICCPAIPASRRKCSRR